VKSIPYPFIAFPVNILTEEIINDHDTLIFLIWIFSKAKPYEHEEIIRGKKIKLEPFEFIFGREKCAKETGLSLKKVRNQINHFLSLGRASKRASKTASTFTVYKVSTEAFTKNAVQQKGQQNGQSEKNEDPKTFVFVKKETNKEKVANSPLSFKNEDLEIVLGLIEFRGLKIKDKVVEVWFKKYTLERITETLNMMCKKIDDASKGKSKDVENHERWMENALKKDFASEKKRQQSNFEFLIKFQRERGWFELRANKLYATDPVTKNDYQYRLPPETFKQMIMDRYDRRKIYDIAEEG
jgi:hypothetical protein